MIDHYWIGFFVVLAFLVGVLDASAGDVDPFYSWVEGFVEAQPKLYWNLFPTSQPMVEAYEAQTLQLDLCKNTGCVGDRCFPHCKFPLDGDSLDGHWYMQEPLYWQWRQWDCQSDCRYYCMVDTEKERASLGLGPVKYHGKWPFQRVYGIQEPVSVALSALNLAMHFRGWLSFFTLLYHKLPLKPDKKPYYDYTSLWHIYSLLAINSWFWSAVFHSRSPVGHSSLSPRPSSVIPQSIQAIISPLGGLLAL
ncbi:hypothetical protein TEA_019884 [Camellia sinensis var. sinensis]|uniref:Post-GPI attachment to proteins factor 3 n=1 Tax=Camellia sinensis var. sinensis TaxID=542762 RepID=A0A4S4DC51_CAMSN|nr:hypothetical protein TEA_019884 [Camellia sinensis var. sinensis]